MRQVLLALRVALSTRPTTWLQRFLELGCLDLLLHPLIVLQTKPTRAENDDAVRTCPARSWLTLCHICAGTGLTPRHICAGTGLAPVPHLRRDRAQPCPRLQRDWARHFRSRVRPHP